MIGNFMIEREIKSFDGLKIKYWINKKNPNKPFLFFIHGLGGNSTAWNNILENLEHRGYSTLKIDLRGHGMSDKPFKRKYYSLNNHLRDIQDVLKKEKINKAIFIGHSYGGSIILRYLLEKNNKIQKVVLFSTPHTTPFKYHVNMFMRYFYHLLKPLVGLLATISFMRKSKYNYPNYSKLNDKSEFELFLNDLSGAPLKVFLWNYLLLFDYKLDLNKLSNVKTPALLINSINDPFLSPRSLDDLDKILKNSKIIYIKDCDHEALIRKSSELAKPLIKFIESCN
jgi:pimeloyl-ACP methyl ester carboxylesterase